MLKKVSQLIESVNDPLKGQLDLEDPTSPNTSPHSAGDTDLDDAAPARNPGTPALTDLRSKSVGAKPCTEKG